MVINSILPSHQPYTGDCSWQFHNACYCVVEIHISSQTGRAQDYTIEHQRVHEPVKDKIIMKTIDSVDVHIETIIKCLEQNVATSKSEIQTHSLSGTRNAKINCRN